MQTEQCTQAVIDLAVRLMCGAYWLTSCLIAIQEQYTNTFTCPTHTHTHTASTYITLTAVCWWVAAVIAAGLLCGANTDRLTNTNRSAHWETVRADVDGNAASRPSEMLRCGEWKMLFFRRGYKRRRILFRGGVFWTWDVLTFGLFAVPCCCKTSPRTFVCNREKLDSSLFFFFFF